MSVSRRSILQRCRWVCGLAVALLVIGAVPGARADDGYDLWLGTPTCARGEGPRIAVVSADAGDPTVNLARAELACLPRTALSSVRIGTARTAEIRALGLPLDQVGDEGFVLRSTRATGAPAVILAANRPIGLLYGAAHLARLIRSGQSIAKLDILERPRVRLRLLNHWDNLDRSVERGYAGQALWDWWKLPDHRDPRYADYARANASIGINGAVLNNVNAKSDSLTAPYIAKAAALADVFRPYGIRVYLSARWTAPMELGGLKTADPLDSAVAAWWRAKADEIYRAIPDFGGFLVKANSEGQPGPQDFGRSHAEGANMLAAVLRPHGGVVMWRAFVYQAENPQDRARQAYDEFKPLDGRFADNVIVQVKNGPVDFQPREPFHPLFGAMRRTPVMMEVQVTKEYLGFATHLAFLGPLYEEVLRADTHARGPGSTVARVVDGSLDGHALTGMAGVANIGSDLNWTGSIFDQANWYAFGRLAWDPDLDSASIAREWAAQTFTPDPRFVDPAVAMMLRSRQAVVDYMTPLGLAHLMATDHHYGPAPWVSDLARPEWNPVYYHRADRDGIGFDRTAGGSNAVAQYAPPVAARFADRDRVGDDLLLWFHRVGWDERLASGRTLWAELIARYDRGVGEVAAMQAQWDTLESYVDHERFRQVRDFLGIQHREARWWRDASIAYFQQVSGRPLPKGVAPPEHPLHVYQSRQFRYVPGH